MQTEQSANGSLLRSVSFTYTATGKLVTATDANGGVTRYAYDLLDRRVSTTDPMGRITQQAYDALSRPTITSNPMLQGAIPGGILLGQTWTKEGLRASLTDALNNTTNFGYDGFGRLATTTYPDGSTESLSYDTKGNIKARCTRAGQPIAFGYDTLNRLSSKTLPGTAGSCTDTPSGNIVTYTWDLASHQTSVSDNSPNISPVGATGTVFTTTTEYDALNRPTNIEFSPATAATQPTSASSVLFTHGYNAANQRTYLSVDTVAPDTPANWIDYPPSSPSTTSYVANNLNQYTAVGSAIPAYDANGNLTDDGSAYKFDYDPENRLVTAKTSAGATIATYAFDARGRRKSKTTGGTTTVFVTDQDNREVLEYDGSSGAILRWYAYGLGPNDVLAQTEVGAGTRVTPIRLF